ncbi:MAG: Gfo/Idh/MocA family oxidoreductase [Actinobacteria bacterium]|nr:Gfo/Idh/MocA family oxidoreductase [Actinomycetota bacterium]
MFARALQEDAAAEVVAICDRSAPVCESAARALGVPGYADVAEMLAAHPELTAAVIATPDFAHREAAVQCARAGLDLMIEKPLATGTDDAEAIAAAAGEAGVRVMVGFENRWNIRFASARELLGSAAESRVTAQIVHLNDTIHVPTRMLSWAGLSSPAWFLMPHTLDLACWIGRTRPVAVYAVGARTVLPEAGVDTWDRVTALFTMADGSHVSLNSSWILPESMPAVFDFRYEIQTASELVHIDGSNNGVLRYDADGAHWPQYGVHEHGGRIEGVPIDMVRDFVRLVRGEDVDVPGLADGLLITEAIAAVHTSLETGRVVEIAD